MSGALRRSGGGTPGFVDSQQASLGALCGVGGPRFLAQGAPQRVFAVVLTHCGGIRAPGSARANGGAPDVIAGGPPFVCPLLERRR